MATSDALKQEPIRTTIPCSDIIFRLDDGEVRAHIAVLHPFSGLVRQFHEVGAIPGVVPLPGTDFGASEFAAAIDLIYEGCFEGGLAEHMKLQYYRIFDYLEIEKYTRIVYYSHIWERVGGTPSTYFKEIWNNDSLNLPTKFRFVLLEHYAKRTIKDLPWHVLKLDEEQMKFVFSRIGITADFLDVVISNSKQRPEYDTHKLCMTITSIVDVVTLLGKEDWKFFQSVGAITESKAKMLRRWFIENDDRIYKMMMKLVRVVTTVARKGEKLGSSYIVVLVNKIKLKFNKKDSEKLEKLYDIQFEMTDVDFKHVHPEA